MEPSISCFIYNTRVLHASVPKKSANGSYSSAIRVDESIPHFRWSVVTSGSFPCAVDE